MVANKGFESVDSANTRARGQAVLDYRVAVGVVLRGLPDFNLGYGIEDPEQAILWVRRASPVGNFGIHEVAACAIKRKYTIDERDRRRTDVNLFPLESVTVESVLVEVDDGPVDGGPVRLVR